MTSSLHWIILICADVSFFICCKAYISPDYSGRVNVNVSEILTGALQPEDMSWARRTAEEYSPPVNRASEQTSYLNPPKPDSSHTNIRKMRRILSRNFEQDWMSIEAPSTSKKMGENVVLSNSSQLLEASRQLNITFIDKSGVALKLQNERLEMLRNWMVQQASCPMDFIWEDLGPIFWPRWIKRGVCLNTKSCSWPAGMRCRPGGSKTLKLLRWVCKSQSLVSFNKRNDLPARVKRRRPRNNHQRKRKKKGKGRKRRNRKRLGKRGISPSRVRRLIRKLSLTANGFYCKWDIYKYVMNENCVCGCT